MPAVSRLGGWLTCDGLGALIMLLVAFVGFTAALYSWGYIGHRPEHGRRLRQYYGLYNLFTPSMLAVPMLAVPMLANVVLMWMQLGACLGRDLHDPALLL